MRYSNAMAALALLTALAACSERGATPTDIESVHPSFKNDGISGHSGAPGDDLCSRCHDPDQGAASPTVTLSGPTSLGPGETGTYTLSIAPGQGSNQTQGGLDVAVPDGGTLITIAGEGTSINNGEIVHSQPQPGDETTTLSWSFQWQAPGSGGTYNMYAVGLSTDGHRTSGDEQGTDVLAISVQAANTPPSANSANVDTDINTPVAIVLSGSDAETCELTFAIVNAPSNGSLNGITDQACGGGGDEARVTYTPGADYVGADQFSYSVTDADGASAQATVDVNVIDPGSNPPNADSRTVETEVDTQISITLSGSDGETCDLNFAIVSGPSHGSLGATADQACSGSGPFTDNAAVTYTPANGYTGSDQFTYSVTDGDGESAQATVDIDVIDPTAVDYSLVRVRARADKQLNLEAAFFIKNNGNRQQGPVPVELYVDDPQMLNGGPTCTMQASDEPGRGSTAYYFASSTGCVVSLDTKVAPADYQITIRLVDQSPDELTDVVHVRQIGKLRGVMSAIRNALRGGGG